MSSSNNDCAYNEREKKDLELYDQGKSTREIAKELRMFLRDIGFILKKGQVNHGIVTIMDNGNNSNNNSSMRSIDKKEFNTLISVLKIRSPLDLSMHTSNSYTQSYIITIVLNKVLIKVGSFVMAILFRYLDIHNSKHL